MKRVIVTGAAGFIGSHALESLKRRGYEVHAVSRVLRTPGSGVTWHAIDLHDVETVRHLMFFLRPTHLLHFAWYAEPADYRNSKENLKWVGTSLALLRSFHEAGGRRAVMAGSCAEYDWNYEYLDEFSTPLNPDSLYGACKKELREKVEAFAGLRGLSLGWGRIFFLFGGRERPERFVPSAIRSFMEGRRFLCTHGESVRDFLHVSDAGVAFAAFLDSGLEGPVNIASGRGVRIREVLACLRDILGKGEITFENTSAEGLSKLVASVKRLSELGWQPRLDLKEGLAEAVRSWKETVAV